MLKIDNLILVFIPLSLGTGNCSASCVLQPGRSLPGDISVLGRSLPGEVSVLETSLPGEVSVLGRSLPGEVSAWGGLCMGEISVLEWPFPPPPSSPTPRGQASDPWSESKSASFVSASLQLFPKGRETPLGRMAERDSSSLQAFSGPLTPCCA